MGYMGTSMTEEEIRKLGQGAAQFKAELPKTAAPTGSVPMVGPVLPGAARPNVPVSASTATPQNTTLQGPYANPNGGYQAGLNVVGGVPQYNQPQTPPQTAQPMSAGQAQQGGYPGMLSAQQISAEAAARIAKQRAAIEGAVTSGKTARTNLYDYTNKTTNDSRVLGDFSRTQTASPFGNLGKKTFDEGLVGRQREMDDTFSKSNYTNDINTLDNQLTSFDTLAPEQQQSMINEMTRLERQYGLELGSLMGSVNGQRTLAGSAQDFNQGMANKQFGLDESSVTGNYNGTQTQQAQAQQFGQNMATKQLERGNFESDRSYNLAKSSQEWTQTFQKEQYTDQKAQQIWDNTFKDKSFTQSMNDAAASRGLQWASLNQRDKEFVADSAFREKTFSADQEQRKIDNLKSGSSAEINKEIDGLYTGLTSGQITGSAAIQEIDGKVNAGILSKADADRMKSVITTVTASLPNVKPKLTQDQIDASGGNNPQDLNSAQLDKLWNTDPTGKAAGRPSIDWAMWYTDPRGKVGGISYDAWKKAYGPQLTSR
jgi:hypothetical protein